MSFFTGNNYCNKCGKPLGIFEQGLCVECEKAEQEPCEDAVSRQAIKKLKRHNLAEGQFVSLYDIEQLPSVRPQEQTGRWIKHNTGHSRYYSCSKCSCLALNTEVADGVIWKLSKYCPDCGVRMESEQNE